MLVRGRIVPEHRNVINRALIWIYRPVIKGVLRAKLLVILLALAVLGASAWPAMKLGSEFMPALDEGTLLFMPSTLPGISVTEAQRVLQAQDRIITQFPEVERVFGKRESKAQLAQRTDAALAMVGLSHAAQKRPGEISGGMKQRVGIARAFAIQPKMLLLDEPFGALDALTRAHLQDSVMQIHAKLGNTVMMITHDVDEAVLLSDRIVMMTNGPSAHIGEVLDVPLARPRKRLTLAGDPTYLKCRQRVLEFLYERSHYVEAA